MSRNFELLHRVDMEQRNSEQQTEQQNPSTLERSATSSGTVPETSLIQLHDHSREQVSKLVQRLFLLPGTSKVVVFSGVERGSGCTWTMCHCALTLASHGAGSVCVVDANMRSPSVHDFLAVQNHHGLADILLHPTPLTSFLKQLYKSNLWALTCGSRVFTATLLRSENLRSVIAQLRAKFDYVLIDTPALNVYTDAVAFGWLSDGLVLVVKANSSRREVASNIVNELRKANLRLLGTVLNKRRYPVPGSIYRRL